MTTSVNFDREAIEALFAQGNPIDFGALRLVSIDRGNPVRARRREPDFSDHLSMLAQEFSGKPVLLFVHAALNSHIRREISLEENLARFWNMWRTETEFLIENLNARWLKSSSDTIMCHATCDIERAAATAGSILINTIKLYETERLATGAVEKSYESVGSNNFLFDGIAAFAIGGGDALVDLVERSFRPYDREKIAPQILRELIKRAFLNPTVYNRFAKVHKVRSDLERLHQLLRL
jgi:hypothetical protein